MFSQSAKTRVTNYCTTWQSIPSSTANKHTQTHTHTRFQQAKLIAPELRTERAIKTKTQAKHNPFSNIFSSHTNKHTSSRMFAEFFILFSLVRRDLGRDAFFFVFAHKSSATDVLTSTNATGWLQLRACFPLPKRKNKKEERTNIHKVEKSALFRITHEQRNDNEGKKETSSNRKQVW